MVMVVFDREQQRALIRERRATGADRFDEVWDGVYVMSPMGDVVHQRIAFRLGFAFEDALSGIAGAQTFTGVNISDRLDDWTKNFRCPDVAVFLPGSPARIMGAHWYGGPDFAVEVISPYDRSRKKLAFYAKLGVKELLLIDRKPWTLELFRLIDGEMKLVGKIKPDPSQSLKSEVLPVSFRLLPGEPRPTIEVTQADDGRIWIA